MKILIADDDDILRTRLARAFSDRGLAVLTAEGVQAALHLLKQEQPELAVVDLRMLDGSGMELLRALKTTSPNTRALVLTGYGSIANAVEAVKLGAINYVQKPADADDILRAFSVETSVPEDGETPSLARTEWEHIQRVLADCDGNISEAARRLGIHRRSLQRKLQKHPPRQ